MMDATVAVVLRYGLDPRAWTARFERGETWDRTPYGYERAAEDFRLVWLVDHAESRAARTIRLLVRRALGFDLVHVWRNRAVLRDVDVVWTHTEREHLAVAALRLLGRRRFAFRSVAQSVWLWDEWPRLSRVRRMAVRRLLREHDVEIVLSRLNRDDSVAAVPGRPVLRVPFGTQDVGESWRGAASGHVLAVGNDRHRDWRLLAAVASRLPDVSFVVCSLSPSARELDWPANVRVTSATSMRELSNLYATASVVALPLKPNRHASGCTVAIEALGAGVPLVVSEAGGIEEYVAGTSTRVVPVGDVDAFTAAIESARRPSAAPGSVAAGAHIALGLTQADYVQRIVLVTRAVLSGDPVDESVERFASVVRPGREGVSAM